MQNGIVTSGIEVVHLSPMGVWIDVAGKEYLLDHQEFPWFRTATIDKIWNVIVGPGGNLHWPDLDVDLEVASLENPTEYPLIYR